MLKKDFFIELQEYIDKHLNVLVFDITESPIIFSDYIEHNEIENYIKANRKPTFAEELFRLIDKKGSHDSEIYKKAGIDRRHFSKIRSNSVYRIGKTSVIALSLALELNKKEADQLLSSAGFVLSDNDTFDLVIKFCLEKKLYDLDHVNQALEYFSLKPLI
jgi:hypothetical protein